MNGHLILFKNPEALAESFSDLLMTWIGQSGKEKFHLAISGGSTPNLLFNCLALKYRDSYLWERVHFWWVDERMVLPEDSESNFGTARRFLFSKCMIPDTNIHRIHGEKIPEQEAAWYGRKIRNEVTCENGWPRFDLVILGMGEDGHTASIFPDQLQLLTSDKICYTASHPVTGQQRITLTGKTINQAARVCFLVTGEGKADRLTEIWLNDEKSNLLPAKYIFPLSGDLNWFTDEAAAQHYMEKISQNSSAIKT